MKRIVITAVTTFILVSLYGKKATFTYDFTKNKKLCYYADFDIDAAQPDSWDAEVWNQPGIFRLYFRERPE